MGRLALTIDFLESELLCLADEAEDHEPGDEVQAGVESDCGNVSILMILKVNTSERELTSTDLCHGIDHGWESQTEDTSCKNVLASVRRSVSPPEYIPKVLLMQTAHAIPCSRWMVGKTSAEYWKATGPSPSE